MPREDYMRIHSKYFPPDIRALYQIDGIVQYGYEYIKIIKVVYGLKKGAIIACNQLIFHMDPKGYYPVPFTTVLWAHKTRRTKCCLCVDDFGVKYFNKDDADHFLESLKKDYTISTDLEGRNFLRLKIDWNYKEEYVDVSMPKYVKKRLIVSNILNQKDPNMPRISIHSHLLGK